MSGAIHPLPHTPSWRGAQLKHRDNFTFTFTFTYLHQLTQVKRPRIKTTKQLKELLSDVPQWKQLFETYSVPFSSGPRNISECNDWLHSG
jgi:hypothetical protein